MCLYLFRKMARPTRLFGLRPLPFGAVAALRSSQLSLLVKRVTAWFVDIGFIITYCIN